MARFALGRDGYFSLNLVTDSDRIATDKAIAHELLADLSYNAGKRYEDFNARTDRIAEYGLLAKVIVFGAVAVEAAVVKFFRRKRPSDSAHRP